MAQSMASVAEQPVNRVLTIALCFAVAVLEGFDIQAIGVAAPKFAPELGLTSAQLTWIFGITNIGLVIGASLGGRFADYVGRKPVFIASVAIFGLFTFAMTLVEDYTTILVIRFLTGFGFGAALPNMMAVAAEISAPEKRASTAAAMFCGMPLGGGTCALLTQLLPPDFDWRLLFIIGGILPLLLVPALYLLMPETLRREDAQNQPAVSTWTALFGEGRAAPTLLLWLTFLPTLLILYLILYWLPTLVVGVGLDRASAPQASLAFNFASVVGALLFGRAVDRFGSRWPLAVAYALLIGALMGLAASRELTAILFFSGAAGFFLMGANYSLYGVAASYYGQRIRGTGSGASVAAGRIGSIIGPLLPGLLSMGAMNVVQYLVPLAAVAGVAVVLLSFFPRAD